MMLNKFKKILLVFTFLFQKSEAKETDPMMIDVYNKFCRTEFKLTDLRKFYEKHPNSVNLSSLYFSEYQEEMLSKIKNDISNLEKWSEVQRIEAFDMMHLSRSKDLKKMADVIDFVSTNSDVEANRRMRAIILEMLQNSDVLKFDSMKEIIEKLDVFDPFLFHSLISVAVFNKTGHEYIKKYYASISQLPDDFAMKHVLLYYYSFFEDQKETSYKVDHMKTAYELCARDPLVAFEYGMSLMNEITFDNAREILLKIVESTKYYPVYADLALAQIYAHFNVNDKAKIFLAKAQDAEMYFDNESREKIASLSNKLNDKNQNWIKISIGLFAMFSVMGFFLRSKS